MSNILVVYGTNDGHTAKVAAFIADVGRRAGHAVEVVRADSETPDPAAFDGILVGASVRGRRHQKYVRRWIASHRDTLEKKPSAFFQVSLSSTVKDAAHEREAMSVVQRMIADTGWNPARIGLFAGALMYTKYSWMVRLVMWMISKSRGGDTDTSKDYEYTDWAEVEAWTSAFFASLAPQPDGAHA